MFIWNIVIVDFVGIIYCCSSVFKNVDVFMFIDNEVMGCYVKFSIVIVVVVVVCDCCYKFDLFCFYWNFECKSVMIFVVIFVECIVFK